VGLLQLQWNGGGRNLHDVDAVRHFHFVGAKVEQPGPWSRRSKVQHGDDFADRQTAEERRRSPQPDIDCRRHVADDLERGRHVHDFERDAQRALDHVLTGDREPEQRRERNRQHLQTEMTERVVRHQTSGLVEP
jgi:hypothetical protein